MNAEWTTALISLVAVLVALASTFVGYAVYRTQADPDIAVYVEPDERRSTIINLVVKNIGNAAARDVSFTSSRPIPSEAFGLNVDTAELAGPMTNGPFVNGIPYLPPGGTRIITWGQFGGLKKALAGDPILVTARYRSRHLGAARAIVHETTCPLEIRSFEGTDASDQNYDKQIAENVAGLTKAVERVAHAVSNAK